MLARITKSSYTAASCFGRRQACVPASAWLERVGGRNDPIEFPDRGKIFRAQPQRTRTLPGPLMKNERPAMGGALSVWRFGRIYLAPWILIVLEWAVAFFGATRVRTPFSMLALILSASTLLGRLMDLEKDP